MVGSREKKSPPSTDWRRKKERRLSLCGAGRLKVDLIVVIIGGAGVGGEESDYYHPHRDDKHWGPRGCRFGCQVRRGREAMSLGSRV